MRSCTVPWLLFAFAFCNVVFMSCRKESVATPNERILGQWKQVQFATDDNNDGILEQYEIHAVAANIDDEIRFNKDSTGTETIKVSGTTTLLPFKWYFAEAGFLERDGIGHNVVYYSVSDVSSLSLTLRTNTNLGYVWYIYDKR